jgi:hypothetical protein
VRCKLHLQLSQLAAPFCCHITLGLACTHHLCFSPH